MRACRRGMLGLRPPWWRVFGFDNLLVPILFLVPTILLLFAIFTFYVRFTLAPALYPLDDPEDSVLPQALCKAASHHVPQGMGNTHGLPVPHIGTGS